MHKGQRYKLGEAAGAFLQRPHAHDVSRPVLELLHMAIHDGGGGFVADTVGGLHHVQPLLRIDFVRANNVAYFVVQNFCRGAW